MRKVGLTTALALGVAGAAQAAPIQLSGSASARAGYGTNPFLRVGQDTGSAIVGGNIAARLQRETSTGATTLSGLYDREFYLRRYGDPDTLSGQLSHRERLTSRLSVEGRVGYSSSSNPYIGGLTDQQLIDPLAIGTRTRRLSASGNFTWQTGVADAVTGGVNYAHTTSSRSSGFGNYDFYSANLGYSRKVAPRTQIGAAVTATRTESRQFGNLNAIQPQLTIGQQLADYWRFDGGIGVIIQDRPFTGTSTSLGFNGTLCGTYPRTTICVRASRQTSASGFGGARTVLLAGVNVSQKLSERETLGVSFTYTDGNSVALVRAASQRVGTAQVDYDRRLSTRLSAGLSGRYQFRTFNRFGTGRAAALTADVKYLFGRTGS